MIDPKDDISGSPATLCVPEISDPPAMALCTEAVQTEPESEAAAMALAAPSGSVGQSGTEPDQFEGPAWSTEVRISCHGTEGVLFLDPASAAELAAARTAAAAAAAGEGEWHAPTRGASKLQWYGGTQFCSAKHLGLGAFQNVGAIPSRVREEKGTGIVGEIVDLGLGG